MERRAPAGVGGDGLTRTRLFCPPGRIVLVAVIDNLVKGAAGSAVQNLNVMLGLDERTGLM